MKVLISVLLISALQVLLYYWQVVHHEHIMQGHLMKASIPPHPQLFPSHPAITPPVIFKTLLQLPRQRRTLLQLIGCVRGEAKIRR